MKQKRRILKVFRGMFGSTVNITIAYVRKENARNAHGTIMENAKEWR